MAGTSLKAYVQNTGVQVNDDALAEALAVGAAEATTGGGGGDTVQYVTFSGKTGELTFGRDREDLDQDEQFILEPRSAAAGWVCWKDSKPVARHRWFLTDPASRVAEDELADHGPYRRQQDGWQAQLGFGFMSADGEVQYQFDSNTKSGKNAIADLLKEISGRAARGEPKYPLFRFTKEKFQAQGEWNWKPKFVVDEWLDEDEVAEMIGAPAEEAEEPEAEAEEVQEEAPVRTRRTRRT